MSWDVVFHQGEMHQVLWEAHTVDPVARLANVWGQIQMNYELDQKCSNMQTSPRFMMKFMNYDYSLPYSYACHFIPL